MWKRIHDSSYFLTFTYTDKYEVYVTDFYKIWHCFFQEKSFLSCIQDSNFALSGCDEEELINNGKQILDNPTELKKHSISFEETLLNVSMTVNFGYPFKMNLNLKEGSNEMFYLKVTHLLLNTVNDLRGSESELRRLLKKKDDEIEEYKSEGGKIALRHLKTKPFSDEVHMGNHSVYEDNFGPSDVPDDVLSKTMEVPENVVKTEINEEVKTAIVKEEPRITIKEEPTDDMDTGLVQLSTIKSEFIKVEPKTETQNESPRKKLRTKLKL